MLSNAFNRRTVGVVGGTYTLGDFTAFSIGQLVPRLLQGSALLHKITYARYALYGKLAIIQLQLSCDEAGTAANAIIIDSLPTELWPLQRGAGALCGYAQLILGGVNKVALVEPTDSVDLATVNFRFRVDGGTDYLGINPALTLAANDVLSMTLIYELV